MAAAALTSLPAAAGPAQLRCRLVDARIDESSGVASASWADDVIFTHNDSGDGARFFAVDTGTCSTRGAYAVSGATSTDWEDMAATKAGDGSRVLWLADIGDNQSRRSSVVVYEVPEPGPSTKGTVRPRAQWTLTYPDGAHDAETLLVDPETGRPVIVTKDTTAGNSGAYRVPAGGSGELELLARLDVRALDGGGLASLAWSLTSGDTSPDRRAVVLRTYLGAWVWAALPGEPLAAVLARPPETVDVPLDRQPEAIAFSRDGRGLWITSEGADAPLHLIPLSPLSPDQPAASPSAPAADPPVGTPPSASEPAPPASAGSGRRPLLDAPAIFALVIAAAAVLTIATMVVARLASRGRRS